MQASMLTESQATDAVIQLVKSCHRFHVAVAWAGSNTVVDTMLRAHAKLGKMVIGTHMYQTNPKVLRAFMPHNSVRCLPPDGRLFHPKVYVFETSYGVAAVVGSHNLTGGAFGGNNIEVSVLLEGQADEEVFRELTSFIASSWNLAKDIADDDFLFSYEAQHRATRDKRNALRHFDRLKQPPAGAATSPLNLAWEDFVRGVKNDQHFNLGGRLKILERATALFATYRLFENMPLGERKAIAGTYGSKEPQLDDLDWWWFGSMFGSGDFKNLVNESPHVLSAALDHIPARGVVAQTSYDNFVQGFRQAFSNKDRQGGVPTASRLLAMKRPDVFVCITTANRTGLCAAFGAAPTTLGLDNYWERIIVPMQHSPWWLHARPSSASHGSIWDNRAALLDSIYYDPSTK